MKSKEEIFKMMNKYLDLIIRHGSRARDGSLNLDWSSEPSDFYVACDALSTTLDVFNMKPMLKNFLSNPISDKEFKNNIREELDKNYPNWVVK